MQWSPNLCRICSDLKVCQTITAELREKIHRYLNIEMAPGDDYKPQHMCYMCISKLINFANFIDETHKNDSKFDSLYKSCVEMSSKDRNGQYQTLLLKPFKSLNEFFPEKNCNKLFTSKSQGDYHERVVDDYKICSCMSHRSGSKHKKKPCKNKFQCTLKRSAAQTTLRSRPKQSACFMKTGKNKPPKSRNNRYMDLCKKYFNINSRQKKNKPIQK